MRARTALATALLALCVAVPAAGQQRYAPAVAFDGATYLVVWEEQPPAASRDIYAARVSEAGVVLDPVGIPISKAAGNQRAPAVAFDGTSFVVVWQDDRSPSTGPDVPPRRQRGRPPPRPGRDSRLRRAGRPARGGDHGDRLWLARRLDGGRRRLRHPRCTRPAPPARCSIPGA